MNMIFWQNIISPHQVDLLSELAVNHNVTLIVQSEIDEHRKKQKWSTIVDENINLIISPTMYESFQLIRKSKNAKHFFSGFLSYKLMSIAMFICIIFKKNIFLISENVEINSFKSKVIFLIRKLAVLLFKENINGIFVTGMNAKKYFLNLGFNFKQLKAFGYFVNIESRLNKSINNEKIKVIFVGRLIESKGLTLLIQAFEKVKYENEKIQLEIIGSGPIERQLKQLANSKGLLDSGLIFTNQMSREKVLDKIESSDLLVLPNIGKEGWGAVVNEALLLGVPVICTKHTGASVIIDEPKLGTVLNEITVYNLKEAILHYPVTNKKIIRDTAIEKISPKVISLYIEEILNNKDSELAPWSLH